MAQTTHFNKISGINGLYTGKAGSEVQVAGGGYLYQNGVQVTKTAAQINQAFSAIAGSTGTGTAIPNAGIAAVSSTSGAKNYVLANPTAAGDKVTIICTAGSTDNTVVIKTGSTACTFDGSHRTLTFNGAGDSVDMVALSTTRWFINVNNGSVALS
jgi:hypothetical protein